MLRTIHWSRLILPNQWFCQSRQLDTNREGSAFLGTASNTFVTIPVSVATILPTQEFAIEVVAPTSAVYGSIVGLNDGGQTSPTFFKTSACGTNALTDVVTVLGSNYGMALSIMGESAGVYITPGAGQPLCG